MSGTNYIASNWRTPTNQNSSKNDNYSLSFNGSSDFISCGNDPQIQLTGNISISAWFKTTSTGVMIIAAKRDSPTGGSTYGWQVYCTGGKIALKVTRSGPTSTTIVGTTTISNGEWHHVLCTINQASQIAIILDGQTEGTASLPAGSFIDSNTDLRIGYNQDGSQHYYFNGEISEVALFDYLASGATLYGNATSGSGNPMALKPTPVGYWPLGDNSASDPLAQPNVAVEDASVFDFDSSASNYINMGNPSELQITGALSISAWVKFTGNDVAIVSKYQSGGGAQRSYVLFGDSLGTTHNPSFTIYNSGSFYQALGTTRIDDGNWHHVLGTFKPSTYVRLYIDGSLDAENTTSIPATIDNDPADFVIGASSNSTFYLNGNINEVAVWNSDQSDEVSSIYNDGIPATSYTNTPTAWYKLDQSANWDVGGSGNWTIPDASGNGNDGTSSGMTSGNLVLSDLTRNLPYENYSLSFDSGVDYVECGNISGLNGGLTGATWSGWFNRSSSGGFYIMGTYGTGQIQFFVFQGNNYVTAYAGNSAGAQRTMAKANVTAFTTNQWYHLTFVYNESESNDADKMKIYIDGVLQANAVAGSSLTSLNSSTASFDIGRLTGTASTQFVGKISNVAIWNTNLSSTEVRNLYANGMPQDLTTFTPQPINWWTLGKESFWDGSDWVIRDMIGTNDGLSSNMGGSELTGDAPRSQANGLGTNIAVPTNLKGEAGWSDKNGYSINMSSTARTTDTP